MTGTGTVASAEPDGSTIGISISGPLAVNTLLFSNLPYDPRKDLALISMLATQPSALAVNVSLGVNSPRELVDLIRRNPGKFAFGSIGSEPFASPIRDFYLTNPIARASAVMAECSALAAGRPRQAAE